MDNNGNICITFGAPEYESDSDLETESKVELRDSDMDNRSNVCITFGAPESESDSIFETEYLALKDKLREKDQSVLALEAKVKMLEEKTEELVDREKYWNMTATELVHQIMKLRDKQKDLEMTVDQMESQNKELEERCLNQKNHADKEKATLHHELRDVTEHLTRTSQELLQSNEDWWKKCGSMAEIYREDLAQKKHDWETSRKQLEKETERLTATQNDWEMAVKEKESQNKELQDLCLKLKNKADEEKPNVRQELQEYKDLLEMVEDEFLQTYEDWQKKCDCVAETYRAELAKREEKWTEMKVKQMELQNGDPREGEEELASLHHKLQDLTEQLTRTEDEFLQSKNDWQKKCKALEDTFAAELAQKEQNWEIKERQLTKENEQLMQSQQEWEETEEGLGEERNHLEEIPSTTIENKKRKRGNSFKKWFVCGYVSEDENSKGIRKELKKRKKEDKERRLKEEKEMKRQKKIAKKELKKKEKEEKEQKEKEEKEIKKQEKLAQKQAENNKSGFWSWMRREKCVSDRKADEVASCSTLVGQ